MCTSVLHLSLIIGQRPLGCNIFPTKGLKKAGSGHYFFQVADISPRLPPQKNKIRKIHRNAENSSLDLPQRQVRNAVLTCR